MENILIFIDALVEAIKRAGAYNKNDLTAPAVVLWTDKERQWEVLLPQLRERLPLLTFDANRYVPAERRGPAYWLRCMLAGTLPGDILPSDVIPIIYLPGVSKAEMRAVDECPKELQPLVELQYRGVLWVQKNGRDWTVPAFLQTSEGGLGISVGADNATKEALLRALPKLSYEPISRLKKEAPLRAPFFDKILNPDDVLRLLQWLSNPANYPNQLSSEEWTAFCGLCTQKYGFHPEKDGPVTAAQLLTEKKGEWQIVWQRFAEAPEAYPGLPALLQQARPQQLTLFEKPSPYWPQDTDAAELKLRQSLSELGGNLPAEIRAAIYALEKEHGERRTWVWAKLGRSPLVFALAHLATLAQITEKTLGGTTVSNIADAYADWGWQADAAVLDALAAVEKADDVSVVKAVIRLLYRPWLEKAATALQKVIAENPLRSYESDNKLVQPKAGTCILFCDALRFDAGQRLVASLKKRELSCTNNWHLAALPPVTPTSKPAITPVAAQISGGTQPGLVPVATKNGSSITKNVLRKLLEEAGYQFLVEDDFGDPAGIAWTELGAIDQYGHQHGWKVAHHLEAELRSLEGRIEALLNHGWQQVIVVTDHGWLMLPQGLPKVELPQHLTIVRKGRCAVLKEGAHTDQQIVPWYWDNQVSIAVAPGICCYEAGKEYEHGGLSPQECVVPFITVLQQVGEAEAVIIKEAAWKGLRCVISTTGVTEGMMVDIRIKAGDPFASLVASPKTPKTDGSVSLVVEDEDRQGEAALVVVLASNGMVRAQLPTIIGD